MNDIIHLLPDSVANQIAAGEVIQRPSSVIKELVENSIDAQATQISIFIENAGKTSIQVVDNGTGMSETDARLSFERHATSKLNTATDLFALRTMGFRGEALASIAAVAQVELRTRLRGQELGICLRIEGSKFKEQEAVSCPVGSNFIVRNLFFNIPARRKFLKSDHTELSNIMTEYERIALAHPDVAFRLFSNGNQISELPSGSMRSRILGIFGKKLDKQIIPVDAETELANISGFVGLPSSSKKKGAHQFFFTNGRYMRHPYFAKAVQNAFEKLIPEGEQVPFFINFQLDPSRIDVNIHPTKTEIKFQDEQLLWQILLAVVREALGKYSAVPTIDFNVENRPDIPVYTPSATATPPPKIHLDLSYDPFQKTSQGRQSAGAGANWQDVYNQALASSRRQEVPEQRRLWAETTVSDKETPAPTATISKYLQIDCRYIVSPVAGGLMIVDQHKAHQRILYDRYCSQIASHKGISQGLLFPQTIELPLSEATLLDREAETLKSIGFEFEKISSGNYQLTGVPSGTEGTQPAEMLRDVIADINQGSENAPSTIASRIASSMARKVAMPVGVELTNSDMATLMEQLMASTIPNYTPDGEQVFVIINTAGLELLFDSQN